MRRRWHRGAPPPWWPAEEAWPPRGPHTLLRAQQRGFRGWLLVLLIAVPILVYLVDLMLHAPSGGPIAGPRHPAFIRFPFIVVVIAVAFAVRRVVRSYQRMVVRLEAQDRSRRELLADIAHELRTPLAIVQGRLEGILDGVYPRDDRAIGEAAEETRMLARLVEDLGTLAQAERGVLALRREPTDVPALLHDVARALTPEAAAQHVTLRVEAGELPLVDLDPLRIREVLINLASNGIRHAGAGAVVTLGAQRDGSAVALEVRDTGRGMTPDELARIFERFHKRPGSSGSGLGLAIARKLVEAHEGTLTAASQPGQGTRLTATLPVL